MTYIEVKDATSTALGTEGEGGAMFDETITSYRTLRNKAERLIIQDIKSTYPASFRLYTTKPQWTTITDEPVVGTTAQWCLNIDEIADVLLVADLGVTAELDQPLQVIHL